MSKPVLVSGIQPSGKLHIGNYISALKNFVYLQNSGRYQCYFFVADLHSLTADFNPSEKYKQIIDVVLNLLAVGIDPKKSVIFVQSQIPQHAELTWILNTITPLGELKRMVQFKDKASRQDEVNVGLFDYPVLQAADILLYDAEVVPVGEDQLQHLELTRTLARKFNSKFKKIFIEPKELLTETPKIMGLLDPSKKMSKSVPQTCLFLDDSSDVIKEKIKRAATDSGREVAYHPESKPAISNLIRIYQGFSDLTAKEIEHKFEGATYSQFKKDLAELIIESLRPFRARKKLLSRKIGFVEKIMESGRKKAETQAAKKMKQVKKVLGLIKK
ncbi:MAG: tryptophan--tRNA ligase [Patescibacteria group bacterium]